MSNTEPVIPDDLREMKCVAEEMLSEQRRVLSDEEAWAAIIPLHRFFAVFTPFACITLIERIAHLTADLAAARENASQNADRYLACEKRFEEAIAQRDAANLRGNWQLIEIGNLPKAGDELLGIDQETGDVFELIIVSAKMVEEWDAEAYIADWFTYFRPLNAPKREIAL